MRARTIALLALISCVSGMQNLAPSLNITEFIVPRLVDEGQTDAQISCHYRGNFSVLQIFKGSKEIFRFKPSVWPAIRSFPVSGIASISTDHCGSTSCYIQLNNLTEQGSGQYRCDLEHESPPYLYTTRSANMTVQMVPRRKPFIDGFAQEYAEGDEMQAVCRIEPGSMVQWFVNGQIIMPLYGLRTFKYKSNKSIFLGEPPIVKLQCVEERGFTTLGSKIVAARWVEHTRVRTATNTSTNNEMSESMQLSGSDCVPVSACHTIYITNCYIALYGLFMSLKYFINNIGW